MAWVLVNCTICKDVASGDSCLVVNTPKKQIYLCEECLGYIHEAAEKDLEDTERELSKLAGDKFSGFKK